MNVQRATSGPSPLLDGAVAIPRPWVVRPNRKAPAPTPRPQATLARRFEIEYAAGRGIEDASMVAPALPVFEEAFGAFTHGILIQTIDGPIAVEDLVPGMMLETVSGTPTPLLWKGAITLVPGAPSMSETPDRLYRVTSDSLGLGRPTQDQIFGPHARRLNTDPKIRSAIGTNAALMKISELAAFGEAIEVTPVSATRVYHLACEQHETIFAAGLPVETYHPGPDAVLSMSDEMMRTFLGFFPHLSTIRDFGRLAAPRMSADELYL